MIHWGSCSYGKQHLIHSKWCCFMIWRKQLQDLMEAATNHLETLSLKKSILFVIKEHHDKMEKVSWIITLETEYLNYIVFKMCKMSVSAGRHWVIKYNLQIVFNEKSIYENQKLILMKIKKKICSQNFWASVVRCWINKIFLSNR